MSTAGSLLSARILAELEELSTLAERARQAWGLAATKHDDFYLDSVALNLHGYYSGLERIFEKIASSVDGQIPTGANWHQELLNQMSTEIPGVRPAVLAASLKERLEEYRGFRHVVRNVYTYHLSPEKIKSLVEHIPAVHAEIEKSLKAFAEFIKNAG